MMEDDEDDEIPSLVSMGPEKEKDDEIHTLIQMEAKEEQFGGRNPSMADVIFTFSWNVTFIYLILFVVSFKFIEVTLFNIFYYFRFFDISHY